jgi:hypothetical protein
MVLPVEEIPAQPKMLPGLGQLSLERRNRVATGMAADGLALHAGVILDLLNSEQGPPNWMPNAAWLANKREQQALAYEAVTKDVFIRGRPSTPQVVEAFQTLYSDVRA